MTEPVGDPAFWQGVYERLAPTFAVLERYVPRVSVPGRQGIELVVFARPAPQPAAPGASGRPSSG